MSSSTTTPSVPVGTDAPVPAPASTPSPPARSPARVQEAMLLRRLGRNTANYFAGSPLNRLSFLRDDHDFLRAAFAHPTAAFLLMDGLRPMVRGDDASQLAFARYADIVPLMGGRDPFAGRDEADAVARYDSRCAQPLVVFLGLDEDDGEGEGQGEEGASLAIAAAASASRTGAGGTEDGRFRYKAYGGSPYWAIDVTPRGTGAAEALIAAMKAKGLAFYNSSSRHTSLPAEQAAMYALARHMLDWNMRNPFCAQCGQATMSVHGGFKRVCPPVDLACGGGGGSSGGVPGATCASRVGDSNICFPRTDVAVIAAVISADGQRVLLGRKRLWPPGTYSALAGFLEPGESVEEVVRREVWEESGVRCGRVVLHSTQPWPFPANLMIGAMAQALPEEAGVEGGDEAEEGGEKGRSPESIFLGNDPELEDVRWVTIRELKDVLARTASPAEARPPGAVDGVVCVPSKTSIAYRLLTAVAEGWSFSGPQ